MHNTFSEALERLLLQRFLYDEGFDDLPTIGSEDEIDVGEIINFIQRYKRFQTKVRCGMKGKTAQFWMLYLDLFRAQVMHTLQFKRMTWTCS